MDLSHPQVMGIINVTPDSFYEGSRKQTEREIAMRAEEILAQGGSMIDIGAFSTRPEQCMHIIPSIFMTFFITVLPPKFTGIVSGSCILVSDRVPSAVSDKLACSSAGAFQKRSRRALDTTDTEDRLMAAAPNIGLSLMPQMG